MSSGFGRGGRRRAAAASRLSHVKRTADDLRLLELVMVRGTPDAAEVILDAEQVALEPSEDATRVLEAVLWDGLTAERLELMKRFGARLLVSAENLATVYCLKGDPACLSDRLNDRGNGVVFGPPPCPMRGECRTSMTRG